MEKVGGRQIHGMIEGKRNAETDGRWRALTKETGKEDWKDREKQRRERR